MNNNSLLEFFLIQVVGVDLFDDVNPLVKVFNYDSFNSKFWKSYKTLSLHKILPYLSRHT